MSKEYQIKPGSRIELVIFEPQRKIKLSRSTYKVNSYIDFKLYKETFKQFGHYMNRFIIDLHDPHYVSTLYNVDRPKGEPPIKIGINPFNSEIFQFFALIYNKLGGTYVTLPSQVLIQYLKLIHMHGCVYI